MGTHCYQDFNSQPEHWRLVRWLYQRATLSAESPNLLFDLATARLVQRKILLPGVTSLVRLVASIRERLQIGYFRLYHNFSIRLKENNWKNYWWLKMENVTHPWIDCDIRQVG